MTHLPAIRTKILPHHEQKYDTLGDYWSDEEGWQIRVSELPDWRYEALILTHELVEMILTQARKIPWSEIDNWDMIGPGKDSDDPGAMPDAPYHKEHMFAEKIEKLVAKELGINWDEYNAVLDKEMSA